MSLKGFVESHPCITNQKELMNELHCGQSNILEHVKTIGKSFHTAVRIPYEHKLLILHYFLMNFDTRRAICNPIRPWSFSNN